MDEIDSDYEKEYLPYAFWAWSDSRDHTTYTLMYSRNIVFQFFLILEAWKGKQETSTWGVFPRKSIKISEKELISQIEDKFFRLVETLPRKKVQIVSSFNLEKNNRKKLIWFIIVTNGILCGKLKDPKFYLKKTTFWDKKNQKIYKTWKKIGAFYVEATYLQWHRIYVSY